MALFNSSSIFLLENQFFTHKLSSNFTLDVANQHILIKSSLHKILTPNFKLFKCNFRGKKFTPENVQGSPYIWLKLHLSSMFTKQNGMSCVCTYTTHMMIESKSAYRTTPKPSHNLGKHRQIAPSRP
jgi:hypothetical protein